MRKRARQKYIDLNVATSNFSYNFRRHNESAMQNTKI